MTAPTYLDDRLDHWAATTPDAEAITYLGRTWTWAELADRVRRLAGALLAEHPAVMEVAVIGVPDDRWGEVVKAVVALKPGTTADPDAIEAELVAYCRERLAHFKCPKSVDVLPALPRNPTGKILKRDLRAPYWSDRERSI